MSDDLYAAHSKLKIRKGLQRPEDLAVDADADAESLPFIEAQDNTRVKTRHFIRLIFYSRSILVVVLFTAGFAAVMAWSSHHVSPIYTNYSPPADSANRLLATYERVMSSAELILSPGDNSFIALMLENDKILCRKSHMAKLTRSRASAYVQMLRRGLEIDTYHVRDHLTFQTESRVDGLPILMIESDSTGCDIHRLVDRVGFPHLTWCTPALKYGRDWCDAIGVTDYVSWWAYRNKGDETGDSRKIWYSRFFDRSWENTFKKNNRRYPWNSKIKQAVWRGSTTGPGSSFRDLQRAKLVKQGMSRPDLIDAGFTSFVQGWESKRMDLLAQNMTIAKKRIVFYDQMKYRAIIDIDGNSWSSRFSKLLCTNSVVIKIDPDWIEYFYDDLQPMQHYIPASLENITEVVAYVLDNKNDAEMRELVIAANLWCKEKMTRDQLAQDAISQLGKYDMAIHRNYNSSWEDAWINVKRRIFEHVGKDLVDCKL